MPFTNLKSLLLTFQAKAVLPVFFFGGGGLIKRQLDVFFYFLGVAAARKLLSK